MCKYNDPGWECELCGARNETGSNPCWQCKGDSRKAARIKREKNLSPVPCDTHNAGLGWDCSLCEARNYGDTGAKPCWQGDSKKAKKIMRSKEEKVASKQSFSHGPLAKDS